MVSADNVALVTRCFATPPAKRKTKETERAAYEQEKHEILVAFKRKTLRALSI